MNNRQANNQTDKSYNADILKELLSICLKQPATKKEAAHMLERINQGIMPENREIWNLTLKLHSHLSPSQIHLNLNISSVLLESSLENEYDPEGRIKIIRTLAQLQILTHKVSEAQRNIDELIDLYQQSNFEESEIRLTLLISGILFLTHHNLSAAENLFKKILTLGKFPTLGSFGICLLALFNRDRVLLNEHLENIKIETPETAVMIDEIFLSGLIPPYHIVMDAVLLFDTELANHALNKPGRLKNQQ